MANFSIGPSVAMNPSLYTFNSSYSMDTIITAINPFPGSGPGGSTWNRYSFADYRNQSFFRYQIFCFVGQGTVRISYPYDSGQVTNIFTPWFRVGNPPFFTISATANYGRTFTGWSIGPGNAVFTTANPYNIGWNDVGGIVVFANFV